MTRQKNIKSLEASKYPWVMRVCVSQEHADKIQEILEEEELTESAFLRRVIRRALDQDYATA